jgi:hypothetical protein
MIYQLQFHSPSLHKTNFPKGSGNGHGLLENMLPAIVSIDLVANIVIRGNYNIIL